MSTFRQDLEKDRKKREEEKRRQVQLAKQQQQKIAQHEREEQAREAAERAEFERKLTRWRKIVKPLLYELAKETVADGRMPRGFSIKEEIPTCSWSDQIMIWWTVKSGNKRFECSYSVALEGFDQFHFYCGGSVDSVPATKENLEEALVEVYNHGPNVRDKLLYPDAIHEASTGAGAL